MGVSPSELDDITKPISGMKPVQEISILNKSDAHSVTATKAIAVSPAIILFHLV